MVPSLNQCDPWLLLEADRETQASWESRLKTGLGSGPHQSNIRSMLADPALRALMEVRENGATNYKNALVLKALGLIQPHRMTVKAGKFSGARLQYITLTQRGSVWLETWKNDTKIETGERRKAPQPYDLLAKLIRSYLVLDRGCGIVVTHDVAKIALHHGDERVLGRLVFLEQGLLQFHLDWDSHAVTEDQWLGVQSAWSNQSNVERSGAGVIDVFEAW